MASGAQAATGAGRQDPSAPDEVRTLLSDDIELVIDGRVATLRGRVHSWYERRAAERAALAVPGVTEIRDDLLICY